MNRTFKRITRITGIILSSAAAGLSICAVYKKKDSQFDNNPEEKNPFEGKKVEFVFDETDPENADGIRGHLISVGDADVNASFYEKYGKRVIDVILSFGGLVALSPILAATAIAIKVDDPGPVLFTQKRVGKNKRYFKLHKFRSMKMATPHDVPTHMLENPDQYITRVGKFLRAHSLDELPQIWDIFLGNMSVIGPRPALWNQDVLTAERDKYGANEIKPGLTGWAQINGRDELELAEKAQMDGEYVERESLLFDAKCFLGTISKVGHDDSVVEGGTGELQKNLRKGVPAVDPETPFGCDLDLVVDTESEKRVLITGAGSYIGESVKKYAVDHYPNLHIESIDMIDGSWREKDFSDYDCVYHVAGIAHADVGNVSDEIKEKYYIVNTDLAIEVANKAKHEGVKQFIFMSSMIVYGESAPYGKEKMITRNTVPSPANFYGDSKWQADKGVRALQDESFHVAVLRPPMIYGKGSKGNYPILSKIAKKLPIFPNVNNQRSMLHIDNLCEFVCNLIMTNAGGIYFPQNEEFVKTSSLVKEIGTVTENAVITTSLLNPAVLLASKIPGKISSLVNKAFGNSCYDQELSRYTFLYRINNLKKSIALTEKTSSSSTKKALQLASVASMIDQFNIPNIELLQSLGYKVDVVADFTNPGTITKERAENLKKRLTEMGVRIFDIAIPRSLDPLAIISAYKSVKRLLDSENYTLLHCHSPIGGVIAREAAKGKRKLGLRVIYTAHGFHFYDGAPFLNWLLFYPIEKHFSRYTDVLITITHEDYKRAKEDFYAKKNIYLPGVGVDSKKFAFNQSGRERIRKELGLKNQDFMLLSVGELNENKNHSSVIQAITGMNLTYVIVGKGAKKEELEVLSKRLDVDVRLTGFRTDVADFYAAADAYILPSFREGLNVSLMEAMSSGLAVACGNIRGNTDLITDNNCLFSPMSTYEIRKAIIFVMENNEILGQKNRRVIESSDKDSIDCVMKQLYEE